MNGKRTTIFNGKISDNKFAIKLESLEKQLVANNASYFKRRYFSTKRVTTLERV